jgi:hypothetical protein
MVQEGAGGLLDPKTVDESEQRLSGDRPEHAMEVEGEKATTRASVDSDSSSARWPRT